MSNPQRIYQRTGAAVVAAIVALTTLRAVAQPCSNLPPIDGRSLQSKFCGAPNALQDNPTGFGDVAPPNTENTEGSELDRLFVSHAGSVLHIGLTGNTPRTDDLGNTILLFIDANDTVQSSILDTAGMTGGSGALQGMSGVALDSSFTPEFCVALWNVNGAQSAVLFDLSNPTATASALTPGQFAWNNENLAGVNAEPSNDPTLQTSNAASATSGVQLALPFSLVGVSDGSTIRLQALITNNVGFISNQNLPPFNPTNSNTGGGFGCIGLVDPNNNPIYFDNYPGDQFASFDLNEPAFAPFTFSGTEIPAAFGNPTEAPRLAATQNNYTCFGDAATFSPGLSEGSELDLLYVRNDENNLYIGVAGNVPINDGNANTIIVFLQTPTSGACNRLLTASVTGGSGALQNMDNLQFDGTPSSPGCVPDGFRPNFAIMFWRAFGANNAIIKDLEFDVTYPLTFSVDPFIHTQVGDAYSADLRNIAGVNNIAGDDPLNQAALALTARRGVMFSLSLLTLGISNTDPVNVSAVISSGSGAISNQFLPPLRPTTPPPVLSSDTFNPNLPITDNGTTFDTRILQNAGNITRITGASVRVNLAHADVAQINIDLRSESTGRVVRLWQGSGTGTAMNTTFADSGAPLAGWVAPGVGVFHPVENLVTLNDVRPNEGAWTLVITDTAAGGAGTLNSWSLDLREDVGGGIGCLGNVSPAAPIDLNNYPGNQFLSLSLSPTNAPASFTAANIPSAFGDPDVLAPLAAQNNYTCFGDAQEAPLVNVDGSEMDQLFVANTANRLRIGITGNLQTDPFRNAFVILLDTIGNTGVNTFAGFTGLPEPIGGGGGEPGFNGITLDAGFAADYAVTVQRDGGAPNDQLSVYLTNLNLASNRTRKLGSLTRNSGSGFLQPPTANQNGSELDQLYVQNDLDNLYIGMTGNLENNGNAYIILLETPAGGGTNTLMTNCGAPCNVFPAAVRGLSGTIMDVGFAPNYAIFMDRSGNNYSARICDLVTRTITNLTFSSTIGSNRFFGVNDNGFGVNSNAADDPEQQAINALSAVNGVQFAISRASLGLSGAGNDGATVRMVACLTGNTGYWSNQSLPGMNGSVGNQMFGPNLQNITGDQFASYVLAAAAGYSAPGSDSPFDGRDINVAMSGHSIAVQNNHTGFGDATLPAGSGNPNCMQAAFDNTNTLGVSGASAQFADSADTGMEFDIAFQDVGLTPLDQGGAFVTVKAMSVLTGAFGYLSNQFLPPLGVGNSPNLENTRPIDLGSYPGDQFLSHTLALNTGDPVDINGDCLVDAQDVVAFVRVLLELNNNPLQIQRSDQNGSGAADGDDINLFVTRYF